MAAWHDIPQLRPLTHTRGSQAIVQERQHCRAQLAHNGLRVLTVTLALLIDSCREQCLQLVQQARQFGHVHCGRQPRVGQCLSSYDASEASWRCIMDHGDYGRVSHGKCNWVRCEFNSMSCAGVIQRFQSFEVVLLVAAMSNVLCVLCVWVATSHASQRAGM